jgi:hypothetical protein
VSKTIIVVDKNISQEKPALPSTEKTILDCYIQDPISAECLMGFSDLFRERLQSCEPSEGTVAIGWEPAMSIIRGYEILGMQNNLCVVNFWFLDTEGFLPPEAEKIPSTLLDKQMTCKYNASERTIEKVATTENCIGPLLDELNKLLEE